MNKEHILDAFRRRHACKEFDPERKVSDSDFDFILETGRLSPSSFGFEPWRFIVLQNRGIREKLLPVTWGGQKQIPTASHFVVLATRTGEALIPEADYIRSIIQDVRKLPMETAQGMLTRYRAFLESDFTLIGDGADERLLFEWASRQTYIALGNMMTSAALIGIDSCPIEGFDKARVEEILIREGVLESHGFGVSCMVAFGYRVREPRDKMRRPIDQVVRWVE